MKEFIGELYYRVVSAFPEREFHYRSNGRVRYFRLSTQVQLGASALVVAALLWSAFATFYFVTFDRAGQADYRAGSQSEVAGVPASRAAQASAYRFLSPGTAQSASVATGVFKTVRHQISRLIANNVSLRNKSVELEREIRVLRDQLYAVRHDKGDILVKLDRRTARSIEEVEKVIAMTGLDPNKLVAKLTTDGKGGPVETLVAVNDPGDAFTIRAIRLQRRLQRWQKLQAVLRRMPLIAPLDHYRKSSGFGGRRDPVTGHVSMHNGLDFAYLVNTPVLSTAPGKVVFAGWRGGYGWMIEIDHGMGIRTRYAHLKKILVAMGQTVAFREKIGLLGSSGRSTGPHVHYEVVIDGRPQDPMKFITAGKYVFKG